MKTILKNRKVIIVDIIFILLCLAFIAVSALLLRNILDGNEELIHIKVEHTFLNFLLFCIPGTLIVLGIIFAGGYKFFLTSSLAIDNGTYLSLLKKFVPKVSKKFLIICGSITLLLPFLIEFIFTRMEIWAPPEESGHTYSIVNILIWMFVLALLFYIIALYRTPLLDEKKEKIQLIDDNLKIKDYIVFGVIALLCFFFFANGDLGITSGNSFAILSGHFKDFYSYVNKFHIGDANYMISTYIAFGIWNLPIRLFTGNKYYFPSFSYTGVILWDKLLIAIVFFLTIILVYKICKASGMANERARLGTYLYATSPIALFAIFIFGQYDVFALFFLLFAIYNLEKGRNIWSVFFIAIGITFKLTVLLIYIPVLLMLEKRLPKLLGMLILTVVPYALLTIYYSRDPAFVQKVSGFDVMSYIAGSRMSIMAEPPIEIYIWVFLFVIACGYCYFQKERTSVQDRYYGIVKAGAIASFAFFGICFHHPQWFIIAAPFSGLMILESKRYKEVSLIMSIAYIAYFAFVMCTWYQNVDTHMFKFGVLRELVKDYTFIGPLYLLKLNNFLFTYENIRSTYFTAYSALFLIATFAGLKWQRPIEDQEDMKARYNVARASSLVPLLFFIGLSTCCLLLTIVTI